MSWTSQRLRTFVTAAPAVAAMLSRRPVRKHAAHHRHSRPYPRLILQLLILLLTGTHLPTPVRADCECGYLSTVGSDGQGQALFTDLLETDFTRLGVGGGGSEQGYKSGDDAGLAQNADWAPQAFNLSRARARGDYGEMFAVRNIGVYNAGSEGDRGNINTTGLELMVKSDLVDGMVPVAELDTRRLDLFYGTFRASMKVTSVPGTCAAFFWYFNDTQEIDMEFLSKDFNASNSSYPINLVLQSREAVLAGYDASKTGNFIKAYLPFDPAEDFHEYRIDYLPGRVFFYADGAVVADMQGPAVPSSPGHLILQHWSNGNRYWSGGPPGQDAALRVRYVKAYFNSSTAQRQQDLAGRCRDTAAADAVCKIPDVTPTNATAASWFFTDHGNMTGNQTASSGGNEAAMVGVAWWTSLLAVGMVLVCTGLLL